MFWKIYFYFYALVNISIYAAFLFVAEASSMFEIETASDVIGMISAPIGLLGLYGLIKDKKLLFQKFWIGFFFVLILNEVLYGTYSIFGLIGEYEINLQIGLLIAGACLLFLPYYIGIYIYAVKKEFWYEKQT